MPTPELDEQSRNFAAVARAIEYIRANARAQPTLEEVAAAVHLSPFHLQRLFSSWAGISPKRFLQYLTKEHARRELAKARDVLSVAADSGLSSGSRLHDLMVHCEALSPGEIRSGGLGIEISCGFAPSPFGDALIAWTARGVCHLAFCSMAEPAMLAELLARWPAATTVRDDEQARRLLARIFPATPARGTLHLLLRGTNFQIKVWEALIRVEPGTLISYGELARRAAAPNAQRAVGSALAANRIAYLIPCHRVIRESGEIGSYRWGSSRKLALLGWEAGIAERTRAAAGDEA
ncbi:methylated-DNA--[protein]-cysteine S-methyltransferase [Accumulibacter sp.]|uniref:methylated-DNA--[protein]-cysteine S-methyltransferase n=1 Tax=Accumulibacter sp. TaxID=2053492 RepID=UPI0025D2DF18|nr:methylated-DNA--[protein]-cysteine S-methyltransferase [Accumulibacter sp.]MCM8610542.1 methylated-DNA--[protein]-cysteine S-methyltransferase [Accumulibacter sp.]MCM8634442.1 methylated-DNA--[protein]-cysteine S-methyltransferase [Accumulibacter sp.]MCM8641740.1 methylated-DNA--[protein]-cysteine S-methyltransferase [Accumulibacter sp.]